MESMPNTFEQLMNEYEAEVERSYNEEGPEAARFVQLRFSVRKAEIYASMGLRQEALDELEDVCNATAKYKFTGADDLFHKANELWKNLRNRR